MKIRTNFTGAVGPFLLAAATSLSALQAQAQGVFRPTSGGGATVTLNEGGTTHNVPGYFNPDSAEEMLRKMTPQQHFKMGLEQIQRDQRVLAGRLGDQKFPSINPKKPDPDTVHRLLGSINRMASRSVDENTPLGTKNGVDEARTLKVRADNWAGQAAKAGILPRDRFEAEAAAYEAKVAAEKAAKAPAVAANSGSGSAAAPAPAPNSP